MLTSRFFQESHLPQTHKELTGWPIPCTLEQILDHRLFLEGNEFAPWSNLPRLHNERIGSQREAETFKTFVIQPNLVTIHSSCSFGFGLVIGAVDFHLRRLAILLTDPVRRPLVVVLGTQSVLGTAALMYFFETFWRDGELLTGE